jgi:hypothetical protein
MPSIVKIAPEIDAKLYTEMVIGAIAKGRFRFPVILNWLRSHLAPLG